VLHARDPARAAARPRLKNSRPSLQIECAAYFEHKGDYEKAVQLYQKGGDVSKALDLCFKVGGQGRDQIFELLGDISQADASPEMLARCAEFFIEHGQFAQAVKLFVAGGRYHQAIELCVSRKLKIDEQRAEQLTPPSEADSSSAKTAASSSSRAGVLEALAAACKKQGAFQLACKKYTQAGNRPEALRALLKSGDTKNIIYYASISRNRDIFVLTANYLQSLDWQSGTPEATALSKKIVEFYQKAKAHDKLADFYDAYAQVEIDEYRDYEKALQALRDAKTHLEKQGGGDPRAATPTPRRLPALEARIAVVADFVAARANEKTDPEAMAAAVHDILKRKDVHAAIRVGDAYALLVEYHFHKADQPQEAYDLLQQMRAQHIALHPYIEQHLLDAIHRALGIEPPANERKKSHSHVPPANDDVVAEDDDDIPDDIPDEIEEVVDDDVSHHHK